MRKLRTQPKRRFRTEPKRHVPPKLSLADHVILSGVAKTLGKTLRNDRDRQRITNDLEKSISRVRSQYRPLPLSERQKIRDAKQFLTQAILHPDGNDDPT